MFIIILASDDDFRGNCYETVSQASSFVFNPIYNLFISLQNDPNIIDMNVPPEHRQIPSPMEPVNLPVEVKVGFDPFICLFCDIYQFSYSNCFYVDSIIGTFVFKAIDHK